jgi:hypothetical protein
MRALMGLIKDRHGTYYARHKVPERLQEAVARILDNGKARQVWFKKSLGTKVVAHANVRAKPVQMEFDRILAQAEAQFKKHPLRTSLSDIEIKRIADFFYAHELAGDDELRMDGRGDDPMYASIHEQLREAGVEFDVPYDPNSLMLEPGRGLSPRMMGKIRERHRIRTRRDPRRTRAGRHQAHQVRGRRTPEGVPDQSRPFLWRLSQVGEGHTGSVRQAT